jgi:hypothetical protein
MSPNEKSARLYAILNALEEIRKEAARLDEGMLGYVVLLAVKEARTAAEKAIARA